MTTIIEMLLWAIVVVSAAYLAVVYFELFGAIRRGPRKPVSGVESLIGRKVVLTRPFEKSQSGRITPGRVRVDGEDWKAQWLSESEELPAPGSELTIVRVEPESLRLWVR